MCYITGVEVWWTGEAAAHATNRPERYPGAKSVTLAMITEAATDRAAVVVNPDPKSRTGAARLIGYCASVDELITIIFDPDTGRGYTAWPSGHADRRRYNAERSQ